MDHQHFETLIFPDIPISANEALDLQDHLAECVSCSNLEAGWNRLQTKMNSDNMISPVDGFMQRWKEKINHELEISHRRQAWWIIGIYLIAAFIFLGLIMTEVIPNLTSPKIMLLTVAESVNVLIAWFKVLSSVAGSILRALPGILTPSTWTSIIFSMGSIMLLWIMSIRQLALNKGVIR